MLSSSLFFSFLWVSGTSGRLRNVSRSFLPALCCWFILATPKEQFTGRTEWKTDWVHVSVFQLYEPSSVHCCVSYIFVL